MLQVEFSALASDDLKQIHTYIAQHNKVAAKTLIDRIEALCELLAQFPTIGHRHREIHHPAYLCHNIGSYLIVYRHSLITLTVIRVIHGQRDVRKLIQP